MITPSISDSYAEYLRIQIARASDSKEVETLRKELDELVAALYKKHKEMIARSRRC